MKVKFDSARQMLEYINEGNDLYSPSEELYVFTYNDVGSIAVYHIDNVEAKALEEEVREYGDGYWGALLGFGGEIYDDPSYELYTEGMTSNLEICGEFIKAEDWILTKDYGREA